MQTNPYSNISASYCLIILLLFGCGTSKTLKQVGWSKGCPLERLDWMEMDAGYDSKTMLEIASKLEAAAQSDLKAINGNASAKGELNTTLKDIINRNGSGKIKVSQEFYQNYIDKRSGVCGMYQGIKNGIFKGSAARAEAAKTYQELLKSFALVRAEEQKKSQQ